MPTKPELKPCPFCGSPAEFTLDADHHGEFYSLGCTDLNCPAHWAYYTESPDEVPIATAVGKWNTRERDAD